MVKFEYSVGDNAYEVFWCVNRAKRAIEWKIKRREVREIRINRFGTFYVYGDDGECFSAKNNCVFKTLKEAKEYKKKMESE